MKSIQKTLCFAVLALFVSNVHAQTNENYDPFLIGADLSKLPLDMIDNPEELVKPINMNSIESFLTLVVDMVKDAGAGFPVGDTLYFSIWDEVRQKEHHLYAVTRKTDQETQKDYFEVLSSAIKKQVINLEKGWNMVSLRLEPGNKDMEEIMGRLIDQKALVSVQDEQGKSLENWGIFGGWKNNIGDLEATEGYKVNVSMDCALEVTGYPVELPLEIPLIQGWNLISFPKSEAEPIINVFQPLMDQGVLLKVQNEEGQVLEQSGNGEWINTITNLKPGKAYQVKVSEDGVLIIK